jgi:hypothetical protein
MCTSSAAAFEARPHDAGINLLSDGDASARCFNAGQSRACQESGDAASPEILVARHVAQSYRGL